LKLATEPRHLPALIRLLETRAGRPAREARLVGTYFDTPDGELTRRGLTLRVREQDGSFVQTVKSGGDGNGAALMRGEWEDLVASGRPDPSAPQTGDFIPADAGSALVALVRTEIARRTVTLCLDAATRIEAAVDRGHVGALPTAASEPVCEVELELKRGNIAALYDLALALLAVAPVRLERRSKAARGFHLATRSAAPASVAARHASPVDLDRKMTAGAALRCIVCSCTEQIVGNEAAVHAGMPEGVHQMRVGVRRLRAFLSAFAPLSPNDYDRWLNAELRWLGGILGIARNLDVVAEELIAPEIATEAGAALDDDGIAALQQAVAARRAAAQSAVVAAMGSARYTALVLRLLHRSDGNVIADTRSPGLSRPLAEIGAEILDRRSRAVRRHAAGFAKQSPEQRHRLRIALKKLRYPLEMFGRLYDAAAADRLLRVARRLQGDLGDANDLRMARGLVTELARDWADTAIATAGGALLDRRARRLARRERDIRNDIAEIREHTPFW
jgi:triphosphatase